MAEAVIVDVVRTASGRGKIGGALSGIHPVDLLSTALEALVRRTGLDPALIDDVIGGCVGQVGEQSANITRQAVLAAGFPEHVPATTIDRQCGSSQQAAAFAAQAVISGMQDVVIACGVESMSRVPLGSQTLGQDFAGSKLRRRYPDGLVNQGISAELIAARWGLSRARLDDFSAQSHARAATAEQAGLFADEIVPIEVMDASGAARAHTVDETVRPTTTAAGPGAPRHPSAPTRTRSGSRRSSGRSRRGTPRRSPTAPPQPSSCRPRRREPWGSGRAPASSRSPSWAMTRSSC